MVILAIGMLMLVSGVLYALRHFSMEYDGPMWRGVVIAAIGLVVLIVGLAETGIDRLLSIV